MSLRGGTTKQSPRVLFNKNSHEIATLRSQWHGWFPPPQAFIPSKKSVYLYIPQPGYPIKKDNRAVLLKEKRDQKPTVLHVVVW